MTIIEALKSGELPIIRVHNRWLYWGSETGLVEERNQWVVRFKRRSVNKILLITPSEEEAVTALLNGVKQ